MIVTMRSLAGDHICTGFRDEEDERPVFIKDVSYDVSNSVWTTFTWDILEADRLRDTIPIFGSLHFVSTFSG